MITAKQCEQALLPKSPGKHRSACGEHESADDDVCGFVLIEQNIETGDGNDRAEYLLP